MLACSGQASNAELRFQVHQISGAGLREVVVQQCNKFWDWQLDLLIWMVIIKVQNSDLSFTLEQINVQSWCLVLSLHNWEIQSWILVLFTSSPCCYSKKCTIPVYNTVGALEAEEILVGSVQYPIWKPIQRPNYSIMIEQRSNKIVIWDCQVNQILRSNTVFITEMQIWIWIIIWCQGRYLTDPGWTGRSHKLSKYSSTSVFTTQKRQTIP